MDENLLELSENCENSLSGDTMPPLLMGTPPVMKKSILKPSQQDNLIQLCTPVHKGLKVKTVGERCLYRYYSTYIHVKVRLKFTNLRKIDLRIVYSKLILIFRNDI